MEGGGGNFSATRRTTVLKSYPSFIFICNVTADKSKEKFSMLNIFTGPPSDNGLSCTACNMKFTELLAIEKHFAGHENDNGHVCALCDEKSKLRIYASYN